MGMEFRPYYLSREWVKQGHKVTIIAGDYSHLRKKNPSVLSDFTSEDIDGIEYVWLRTGEYEGNGVKRALTMERFIRKLYLNAAKIAKKYKTSMNNIIQTNNLEDPNYIEIGQKLLVIR